MNTGFVTAGLFLLFEPEISFADILPDFIGLLLILKGIGRMALVSPSAEDAVKSFRRAAACSAIKLAVLLPMISVTSSDPAFNMIFTLVFGIAECLFVIPAFAKLGDSIEWFSSVTGRQSLKTGKMTACVGVMFIQKYVFALLPQLVYLDVQELDLFDGSVYPLAGYKTPLVIICFTLSLVAGVVCLILLKRFFRKIKLDTGLLRDINTMLSSARIPAGEEKLKAIKIFVALLLCAVWTGFPLEIDGSRLIPAVIPAFFSMLAVIYIKNAAAPQKATKTWAVLFAGVSVPVFGVLTWFNTMYNDYASANIKRVADKFIPAVIAYITFLIVFAVFAVLLRKLIGQLVYFHTGVLWENPYITHNSSVERQRAGLYNRFNLCLALALMISVAGSATFVLRYTVDWIRLPYLAFYLVFAVILTSSLLSLRSMCSEKYSEKSLNQR
ncbi:MAG: hypothetical protein J5563_00765 [Clostridia bacterium]|nr:hypothetical protein [Clostridia bacterium]